MKHKLDKKSALKIITIAAQQYDKFLKDKHFLIIYQQGKLKM